MKITAREAAQFIAKPPAALAAILLYGYDRGLIRSRRDELARGAVADINDPFAVSRLDADSIAADPALLFDSAAAMPATGGRRLVLVDDAGAGILAAAKNLLAAPPPESLTIITADAAVNTKSALVRLFESNESAAAMGCYPDAPRDIAELAQGIFREENIRIDSDALQFLTASLGADHMASRGEIEKLVLLAGSGGHLDLAAVREAIGDGAAITAGDVIHAAACGDMRGLSLALARARAEGIEGEKILRLAVYHFTRLFRLHAAIRDGASRDEAMRALRPPVFFAEKRQVEGDLGRWNIMRCRRAIDRLAEAEMQARQGVDAGITASQALLSLASAVRR